MSPTVDVESTAVTSRRKDMVNESNHPLTWRVQSQSARMQCFTKPQHSIGSFDLPISPIKAHEFNELFERLDFVSSQKR